MRQHSPFQAKKQTAALVLPYDVHQSFINQIHNKTMRKKSFPSIFQWKCLKKTLLLMKLTTLFVLLTTLQLSASMYSQNSRVTLNVYNGTLSDVFKEIEKQTEYKIFYKVDQINLQARLNVTANDQAVSDVLGKVLTESGATYDVIDKIIVITPANKQSIKVEGVVTDSKGQPIPGVSVSVKGTSAGSITDLDGKYSVEVPDANSILVFSFMGYLPEEKVVGTQNSISVTMIEDIKQLDEVVVVGYGTLKKSDVTGSVTRVTSKDIDQMPVQNAVQAMQGRAAGLDVTSATYGRPGELGTTTIRGNRSINGSNNPLYVVDGIPLEAGGIDAFNPQDIESLDILKDASATAIYGSRGSNGVILVTTKKGTEGKFTVNYTSSLTLEKINDLSRNFNSAEYIAYRREAYRKQIVKLNSGVIITNSYNPDSPSEISDQGIFGADPFAWANVDKAWAGGSYDPSKLTTTNWTDYVVRTGVTQNHTLSISGGTEKTKGYLSAGYLDQQGTNKDQRYTRYSLQANINMKPNKWFTIGASLTGSQAKQLYGYYYSGTGAKYLYDLAKGQLPYAVPYDPSGNLIYLPGADINIVNPVNEASNETNQRVNLRIMGNTFAEIKFTNWLRYRINFGPDFRNYTLGQFQKGLSQLRGGLPTSSNYANYQQEQHFAYTLENLLYFDKTFASVHKVGITLLQSSSLNQNQLSDVNATNLPDDNQLWYGIEQNKNATPSGYSTSFTKNTMMSYMARLNYSLMDKYLITASGRWDGASMLAAGHQWDFFSSFALAWKLDKEPFMKNVTFISELKPRVGYGTTGNSGISAYGTLGGLMSVYYRWGATDVAAFLPTRPAESTPAPMPNKNLGWEKTMQMNYGLDFGLFANRISGSVDYYEANTSDVLMLRSIPSVLGYTTTWDNIGKTKNSGIEVQLATVNISTKNVKWTTNFTFSANKEQVIETALGKNDDISNAWFIGHPIGVYYDYSKQGIWQYSDSMLMKTFNAKGQKYAAGTIRVNDLNGDTLIDANHDRKIIGQKTPKWTAGILNTVTFKGFDFSVFVYARWGQTIYGTNPDFQGRYASRKVDYWTPTNPTNAYPEPNFANAAPTYATSLVYEDGSFVKVRNISLGYTFPKQWMQKLKISNFRLYVMLMNPFLYTKNGYLDPDLSSSNASNYLTVGANATNPATSVSSKSYVLGLNVTF